MRFSILPPINVIEAYAQKPFEIPVVEPRKTFLEKTFLLHEEFARADYSSLSRELVSFLPPDEVIDLYRADYFTMREHMINREAPDFDEIIQQLKGLQAEFRMNR